MSALVLASASAGRRAMLEAAGVDILVDPASVDEDEVKAALLAEGAAVEHAAETLAELKARRVSPRHAGAPVLGADSMLECAGRWFDKAPDMAAARAQLEALSGREHRLVTSAVIVRDGVRIWHHTAVARMFVRELSPAFLDGYLEAIGADALRSVGCYQVEGRGLQLFSRIEGDFYAIVGLPMLELLEQLRRLEVIPA